MKEIVIVGGKKFTLGFQLAGISKSFQLNKDNPDTTIKELMSDDRIGIIIIGEKSFGKLSEDLKLDATNSVEPVFLVMSQEDSNTELRKLIKKSIGVDLWDKE